LPLIFVCHMKSRAHSSHFWLFRVFSFAVTLVLTLSVFSPVSAVPAMAFTQISFVPNIETAGVVVSGAGLPRTAQLTYRRSGETEWRAGHYLMRIDDGRLVGSLFNLSAATSYDVRVVDGGSEISGSFTTQADELAFSPVNTIYVNDDAPPGGDGSFSAPFRTIQEGVNRASAGTQVLVADGIYHESVKFPASGTPGNWIQVKAEGGGAILDGSISIPAEDWQPYEGKSNVWFIKINPGIKYLARDGLRFYQYDTLSGLFAKMGHNNVDVSEGWYYDPTTSRLYVRVPREPRKYNWQLPRLNAAFMVEGRDWIWLEGFEMRYYGVGYGCGVCATNASHVVVRRNRIHNLQNPVFVDWTGGEDRGNDIRIEYNEMYDPLLGDVWEWSSVKGTSMESIAIVLRGHTGAIVRGNHIHHYFNGIYTSSSGAMDNPGVAFDVDVYNNRIHHIGDDALEPEGTAVNHRFRNNVIDNVLVGISLAPITMGPVWVMRSTISNFSGRGIKLDRNSDGWVLLYHNTSWTNRTGANSMEFISSVHNSVLRNNIFQGNGYSIIERAVGSTGHDWNYDNWSTSASPRYKWENADYYTLNQLCRATGLECNGHESSPGLVNPGGGDFSLLSTSPNIDRGALVPGINDFYLGNAPDIGAFESSFGAPPPITDTPTPPPTQTPVAAAPPSVISILRADASPNSAEVVRFTLNFSEDVIGLDTGDFALTTTGNLANTSIVEINGAGSVYTILVNTGSGDGTLRLDLLDNDSILDVDSFPLGGTGMGNGNFSSGEMYIVNKLAPSVTSSLRADPSPTSAESVRFMVTFSESVSGVDPADFVLAVSGLSEAGVLSVSGVDSVYIVTVKTGNGSGPLRLDVVDNDSILDAAGAPLGGAGLGNGNFNAGDLYLVDRKVPVIQSATFSSDGAQDGWVMESKETSNKGGTMNSNAITFRLGDNGQNNQYRSILSFQTDSLPDNAVITQAMLTMQLETTVGVDPFKTHLNIWVDIRQGAFGSFGPFQIGALQVSDFQAPASLYTAGTVMNNPVGGWYWTTLDAKSFPFINLKGTTQFRLGFQLDDDNDKRDDYLSFFSGDYSVPSARPQLSIKYYVP